MKAILTFAIIVIYFLILRFVAEHQKIGGLIASIVGAIFFLVISITSELYPLLIMTLISIILGIYHWFNS